MLEVATDALEHGDGEAVTREVTLAGYVTQLAQAVRSAHAAGAVAEKARWVSALEIEISGEKERVCGAARDLSDMSEYRSALAMYFGLRRILRRLTQ